MSDLAKPGFFNILAGLIGSALGAWITGTAGVGNVLTANLAPGLGAASSWQWKRNGTNIAGATSSTYTQVTADLGTTVSVLINGTYTGSLAIPGIAPGVTSAPVVSSATTTAGLTWTPGVYTGAPTPTVVANVLVNGSVVASNVTQGSYTPTLVGGSLQVQEVVTNVAGSITSTSGSVTITAAPVLNYLGQVATRTFIPNTKSGSSNYANSRTAHVATQAMTTAPQLAFPGWYVNNGLDTASVGLTYTASIEYPAGTFTQVTWSASTSVAVGAALANTPLSDTGITLATPIPSGATFWVRNFCKVTSGSGGGLCVTQATTSTRWVAAGEALASSGTVIGDQTMSGTVTDGASGSFIYPLAIVQQTTRASFYLVGDSRTIGTTSSGTTPDVNGNMGQVARSIGAAGYAFINGGVGGTYIRDWNRSAPMRLALQQYCSHVINGYGINDLRAGTGLSRSAAQVESDFYTLSRKIYNKPLIGCTAAPQTTSSDSYATAANQTADANDAARQTFNAWVNGLPAPYSASVDVAARAQDAGNAALWKSPSWTGDGLHETTTGYDDIVSSGIFNVATLANLSSISRYSIFALSQNAVMFDVGRASTVSATISGSAPVEGNAYTFSAAVNVTYSATGFGAGNGPQLNFVTASNTRLVGDAPMQAAFNGVPGITLVSLFSLPSLPAATRPLQCISTNVAGTDRASLFISATGIVTCVYRAADADAASTLTAPSAIATGVPILIVANLDPITNTAQLSINGTVVASGTFVTSGSNFSATNSARVGIDTSNVGDTQMTFNLREADFIPVAVTTTAVRQKLEGDVAWRAGVAAAVLPAGHPYLSAAPTSN